MFFLPSGSSKSMLFAEKIGLPSLSAFCDPLAIYFTCRARIRSCNHVIKIDKFGKTCHLEFWFELGTSAFNKSDLNYLPFIKHLSRCNSQVRKDITINFIFKVEFVAFYCELAFVEIRLKTLGNGYIKFAK